ncbi:DUF5949 family protein [Streptomyces sp. NPDC052236]|uniref:DUF5949 family protein n=1 Tax=Streptomyces sp. NPDC052236 TaxID=3365686 RepID=UPI0037D4B5B1
MTTANASKSIVNRSHLGTLSVLAWTGDPEEGQDLPCLVAYSLGDGSGGAEAGEEAILAMIEELRLTVGGGLTDWTRANNSRIKLIVEAGQAAITMPYLSGQCPVPPEWLYAVEERGHAYFLLASRPWPEAAPGKPVTEDALRSYIGDEKTLATAAHVLLPVSKLR